MLKQSLCIFKVVTFKRNVTTIILIRRRSSDYKCVFQCDRNPKKGATQHASRHNVNKPAQNLKKKHQKLYLFKRTDQQSGQEISLKIA